MTYEYFCKDCKKEKEVSHKISESPEIKCDCGQIMKIKITGISGVFLNGSGFTKKSC